MLATLLLVPGFQTSVMSLATLWTPSVKKWSLYKKRQEVNWRLKVRFNKGNRVQREPAWFKESQPLFVVVVFSPLLFRPIKLLYFYFILFYFLASIPSLGHYRTK